MKRLYASALTKGLLRADPRQKAVADALENVQERVIRYEPALRRYAKEKQMIEEEMKGKWLKAKTKEKKEAVNDERERRIEVLEVPKKPRGLYIHGHVGTGKTVMMDMFFESAVVERKRRVHLHAFMLEVHERIHRWKHVEREKMAREEEEQVSLGQDEGEEKEEDGRAEEKEDHVRDVIGSTFNSPFKRGEKRLVQPKVAESDGITQIAKQLAAENTLLAFDEFVVTDVVDALILKHLFGVMFSEGTVMVATSNTAPSDLYKDGLNYHYFRPFIGLLQAHCKVIDMDSTNDYRLSGSEPGSFQERYFTPISPENRVKYGEMYNKLLGGQPPEKKELQVAFGRKVTVPSCGNGVSQFHFDYLCGDREPIMAAADYKSIFETFHTVFIHDVPVLGLGNHNETRRFITLVDQAYDQGVNLILLAEREPMELYDLGVEMESNDADVGKELFSIKEMHTAAKRMRSRLIEMTSRKKQAD